MNQETVEVTCCYTTLARLKYINCSGFGKLNLVVSHQSAVILRDKSAVFLEDIHLCESVSRVSYVLAGGG